MMSEEVGTQTHHYLRQLNFYDLKTLSNHMLPTPHKSTISLEVRHIHVLRLEWWHECNRPTASFL